MLVFSLLSIPALRTVALPPSSRTVTPQGFQDQNSPSGEAAEGIFMAWSQQSKGRSPLAPYPVRDGLLQLLAPTSLCVLKSPVSDFLHPVAKMPGTRKDFTPQKWAPGQSWGWCPFPEASGLRASQV